VRQARRGKLYRAIVPALAGVVMLASPTLLRKAERRKAKAAPRRGVQKTRPLPNLTPSPLNVVNVHCSVFKAYPLVQAAMCLDKSLEGEG